MHRLAALLSIVVLVPACSFQVTAGHEALAALEARWQCDVQRSTHPDLDAIEADLDDRLAGNGFDREQYRDFKDDATDHAEVRALIRAEYEAYCA